MNATKVSAFDCPECDELVEIEDGHLEIITAVRLSSLDSPTEDGLVDEDSLERVDAVQCPDCGELVSMERANLIATRINVRSIQTEDGETIHVVDTVAISTADAYACEQCGDLFWEEEEADECCAEKVAAP